MSSHAIHHDIQAACEGRHKQIKLHQRRLVHDSLPAFSRFVPRETDRCVHLEDIIMARMATIGDRRVTGVCAHGALPRVFLSLISTSLPSGRLTALTGPIMELSNNVGLFRHTHTQSMHAHTQKHICRNIHKKTRTETHQQAQPRGKCHSYAQAKQWSLQGDMKLKDQLCAEP